MATAGRQPASIRRLGAELPLLSVGFLVGSLLLARLPELPVGLLLVAVFVSTAICAILLRQWPRLSMGLLGLGLGFAYCALHAQEMLATRLAVSEHGHERWLSGCIAGLPEISSTRRGAVARFAFVPDAGPLRRIRVAWYQLDRPLKAGECWELKLRLRSPRGTMNPGGFDYEGWLFTQGIDATATVQEARRSEGRAIHGGFAIAALRQRVADEIRTLMGDHPMRPFVLGLAVGDRSEIDDTQWRVLRRTGVAHLLAISGLHIGLIAGFAFFLMRGFWAVVPRLALLLPAPKAAALAACGAGFIYALLAGFALPTQRALVMLVIAMAAIYFAQRTQPSRLLAWALLIVLLLDPFAGQSAGFWLSFAAVGWILYAMTARLRAPGRLRSWLYLQLLLGCSLLPLALLWFAEGSWLAPGVNLLLIPIFFLLVPVILLASLLALLWPALAVWVLTPATELLLWIWQPLVWLEAHSPVLVLGPAPSWPVVVLALLGVGWLFAPAGWPARAAGLLLCMPLALPSLDLKQQSLMPGELEVTVLDVGQGLAVVLRSHEHVLVYDAGPAYEAGFDAGAMVLVPYLRSLGISEVDRYVQSHGDLDHRGGSVALRRELRVLDELGTDKPCRQGQSWEWDDVRFEVLHPKPGDDSGNNASCVLRVQFGEAVVLLTGDIERAAEAQLRKRLGGRLKSTLLLVPHHGSNSSSSMGLLNAVQPELAIVSAGWRNRWGMPRPDVVRRYSARDIRLLNTADYGAISVYLHAENGITKLQTAREQQKRFWSAD